MTGAHSPHMPWGRRLRYGLETALAYFLYGLLRVLPLETASGLCGFVFETVGPRMGISRLAMKNLTRAFPEKSEKEKKTIIRGMWNNLGRVIGEYPHLYRIGRNVELCGLEHTHADMGRNSAVIFAGGHFANWEVNTQPARKNNMPVHLVYRKPNNPWVDGLLRHARDSGGAGHIAKGHAGAREIFSVLKNGGAVALMVDQKLNEGIAVPFFGHDAMTTDAVAKFALHFKCPVHLVRTERLEGAHFRVTIYPRMEIVATGDKQADADRITADINKKLEEWIKERPEQWLWIHKRWPN